MEMKLRGYKKYIKATVVQKKWGGDRSHMDMSHYTGSSGSWTAEKLVYIGSKD